MDSSTLALYAWSPALIGPLIGLVVYLRALMRYRVVGTCCAVLKSRQGKCPRPIGAGQVGHNCSSGHRGQEQRYTGRAVLWAFGGIGLWAFSGTGLSAALTELASH